MATRCSKIFEKFLPGLRVIFGLSWRAIMFAKINILQILRDHWKTLTDGGSNQPSPSDIFVFFVIPIILGITLPCFGILLSDTSVPILLASFSILTGLLFNILVLLFDLIRKENTSVTTDPAIKAAVQTRLKVLHDTFANISYSVLVGILLAILCLGGLLDFGFVRKVISVAVFAGATNFVLTLLMVLKRIHALLSEEAGASVAP